MLVMVGEMDWQEMDWPDMIWHYTCCACDGVIEAEPVDGDGNIVMRCQRCGHMECCNCYNDDKEACQ